MQPDAPAGTGFSPWMIGLGVAGVAVIYILFKRHSSSGSSAATSAISTPYGMPATGTGVLEPIVISAGNGAGIANPVQSTTVGNTNPTTSNIPSTTPVTDPTPGFFKLRTTAQSDSYRLAGKTIYYLPPGVPPSIAALIPWVVNGKFLFNAPNGGTQYVKLS